MTSSWTAYVTAVVSPPILCKFSHVQAELQPNWIIHLYFFQPDLRHYSTSLSLSLCLSPSLAFSQGQVHVLEPVGTYTDTQQQVHWYPSVEILHRTWRSFRCSRRQSNTLQKTWVRSFISYLWGSLQRKAISTILALYCGKSGDDKRGSRRAWVPDRGRVSMLGTGRDFQNVLLQCVSWLYKGW